MTRLHIPVRLRWSDLDAYGHVNNVEMFRLLEEARITAFWRHPEAQDDPWPTAVLESGPQASSHTLVARQEIEYLRPLGFARDPITVQMWIGHIGGASLEVCYEVFDAVHAEETDGAHSTDATEGADGSESAAPTAPNPCARATTTIVLVDAVTQSPRRITTLERAAWEPYVEAPAVLRRRGA